MHLIDCLCDLTLVVVWANKQLMSCCFLSHCISLSEVLISSSPVCCVIRSHCLGSSFFSTFLSFIYPLKVAHNYSAFNWLAMNVFTQAEWQIGGTGVTWPLSEQGVYLLVHLPNVYLYSRLSSRGIGKGGWPALYLVSPCGCLWSHAVWAQMYPSWLTVVCDKNQTSVTVMETCHRVTIDGPIIQSATSVWWDQIDLWGETVT